MCHYIKGKFAAKICHTNMGRIVTVLRVSFLCKCHTSVGKLEYIFMSQFYIIAYEN